MSTPSGPQDPYGQQQPGQQPPQYGQQPGYGAPPPAGYGGGAAQGTPPPNYLVWAIISIFLCWPLAIPAIVFATQVNTKWGQGDAAGAYDASKKAKTWSLWATILGGIAIVLWFVLVVIGGILGAGTSTLY